MKTADYIARLMLKTDAASFAELGRILGVPRSSITQYRQNRHTFDDDTARRVAEILELDGSAVLADMAAQRAHTRDDRKYWTGLGTAAAALLTLNTGLVDGQSLITASNYQPIHYANIWAALAVAYLIGGMVGRMPIRRIRAQNGR